MSNASTQTPYQRWQMSSLAAEGQQGTSRQVPQHKAQADTSATPAALAQILEDARLEGFKKGYTKGLESGYEAGLEKAADVEQHLRDLTKSYQQALQQADESVAEALLALALDIAQAMLKNSLRVKQQQILPIVREAIRYLPMVKKPARILLNPQDAEIVRLRLAEELAEGGWQLIEDATIESGGCVIDTASNQIDATNSTRWKRISDALGQPGEWLQPPDESQQT